MMMKNSLNPGSFNHSVNSTNNNNNEGSMNNNNPHQHNQFNNNTSSAIPTPTSLSTMPSLGDLRGFRYNGNNNDQHLQGSSSYYPPPPGIMSRQISNMTVAGRDQSSFLAATVNPEALNGTLNFNNTHNN